MELKKTTYPGGKKGRGMWQMGGVGGGGGAMQPPLYWVFQCLKRCRQPTSGTSAKYLRVALTLMSANLSRSAWLIMRSASTRSHSCTHSRMTWAGSL